MDWQYLYSAFGMGVGAVGLWIIVLDDWRDHLELKNTVTIISLTALLITGIWAGVS